MEYEVTDSLKTYIASQIGSVAWSAFQTLYNTATEPDGADRMLLLLLQSNCGNVNGLMADVISAVKDKLGGSLSILGRIKVGPIELENYISNWDNKIKEFRRLAGPASNPGAGSCGSGIVERGFTGTIPLKGTW